MPALKPSLAALAACGLAGCVGAGAGPIPGTPEFAAARVSRAYDCGVGVDRGRIIAGLPREDRARFIAANASYAVKSYKAPRRCEAAERAELQHELRVGARR
jgi:hypothetical protein